MLYGGWLLTLVTVVMDRSVRFFYNINSYMLAEKISRYNLLTNIAGVSSSSVSEAGPIFDMCVSCHIKLI